MRTGAVEDLVARQVAAAAGDPAVVAAVAGQVRRQDEEAAEALRAERRTLGRDLRGWHGELKRSAAAGPGAAGGPALARLADPQERAAVAEERTRAIDAELAALRSRLVDPAEVAAALGTFGPLWAGLTPREQARAVRLLIERVEYDGARGKVAVVFRPTGIQALARDRAGQLAGGAA